MQKKMLIDASQREETRVAVIGQNDRVEDFDFESLSKKPLRGNIYLARVTRVEPSLQAAFVEYGGNRHGFLAFSEIHPDYYQIPVSDREILQKAESLEAEIAKQILEEAEDEETSLDDEIDEERFEGDDVDDVEIEASDDAADSHEQDDEADIDSPTAATDADGESDSPASESKDASDEEAPTSSSVALASEPTASVTAKVPDEEVDSADQSDAAEDAPDTAPSDDAATEVVAETSEQNDAAGEEQETAEVTAESDNEPKELSLEERYQQARRERIKLLRNYKIQEVIKRRQILLVQVVKEERGNKGAALTTYLSLAGRYCVLMPNTSRGGGISRKISNASDRKRLRNAMKELEIPQGIGLIIRTAGSKRTKSEIKRDYDYLLRLWSTIRELTMKSIAPCLVYEEASLIKRAIRDLYDKDISEVMVDGEDGYREAKDFMKMLMPSHAKNVQKYKDRVPLFLRHKVEQQLDEMYQPVVKLKSGGYLVIQQTEALISIDVNSGKATKERNIEATALKTNVEAAVEVARQARLRDLAGLVVIDFIDMEEHKNNRTVEKRLKEAMKTDRARIQLGRISTFGLMELSRQRRRSGIVDGTTSQCPTCQGAGAVRSHEMAALRILRSIEEEALTSKAGIITATTSTDVGLYILNEKRAWLARIEETYGIKIEIIADREKAGDQYDVTKRGTAKDVERQTAVVTADLAELSDVQDNAASAEAEQEERPAKKRRRRRRRKSSTDESTQQSQADRENTEVDATEANDTGDSESEEDGGRKRRKRGRRGGKRNRRGTSDTAESMDNIDDSAVTEVDAVVDGNGAEETPVDIAAKADDSADATPPENNSSRIEAEPAETTSDPASGSEETEQIPQAANDPVQPDEAPGVEVQEEPDVEKRKKPKRVGWWQKALGQ